MLILEGVTNSCKNTILVTKREARLITPTRARQKKGWLSGRKIVKKDHYNKPRFIGVFIHLADFDLQRGAKLTPLEFFKNSGALQGRSGRPHGGVKKKYHEARGATMPVKPKEC